MEFIKLNDKEYKLEFNVNNICEMEAKLKVGLFSLVTEERMGFNAIRALLWAGVKNNPGMRHISIEAVGTMIFDELKNGNSTLEDMSTTVTNELINCGVLGRKKEESEFEEIEKETKIETDEEKKID